MTVRRCVAVFLILGAGLAFPFRAIAVAAAPAQDGGQSGIVSASPGGREEEVVPISPRSLYGPARNSNLLGSKHVKFTYPTIGLGASFEFNEDRKTVQGDETVVTNNEYNQWLEVGTDGWIYHPTLLVFSQDLKFEWRQSDSRQDDGQTAYADGFLVGYETRATLLKDKPHTLSLYARRSQDSYSNPFADRTQTETEQSGFDLAFKYPVLPTRVSYAHSRSKQEGFYSAIDEYDRLGVNMSRGGFNYDGSYENRERFSQGFRSDISNQDHHLRGNHRITADGRIRLSSLLSHRRSDSNNLDSSGSDITEHLTWNHTGNLETDYTASYQWSQWNDTENRATSMQARLTHRLYENLVTRLSTRYAGTEYDQSSETVYGGLLDLNYNRSIPRGNLHLALSNGYDLYAREVNQAFVQVTNESHQLSIGALTFLNRQNIDIDTVVVSDTTGTIIYINNIDYRLTAIDQSVRITRLSLGAIPEGGEVVVKYRYLSNPAFDSGVYSQAYSIRFYLWSALSLSFRYNSLEEQVLSGIAPENESDTESRGARLNWVWRWSDTSIDYDDSYSKAGVSTRRWTFEEILTFRPARTIYWGIRGRHAQTEFTDSGDREEAFGLIANQDWTPRRWCKIGLQASWASVYGTLQDTVDKEIVASIRLSYRIWNCHLKYRLLENEDRNLGNKRREQVIFIELFRYRW